jgi:PAS domain S-box-containing protein
MTGGEHSYRTIPISWSLFGAFSLVALLIVVGFLLLGRAVQTRVDRSHSRRLLDRAQLQTEAELRQLLDPIEREVEQAAAWVQRGLVKRYDDQALLDLFLPQMLELPQCVSMMVSDMSGYEFLIMRNLGPGGLLDVEKEEGFWITRDFRRDAWGLRSEWALWDEYGMDCVREWQRELDYDPRPRVWHAGPRRLLEAEPEASTSELYWTEIDEFFTSKSPGITASVAVRDPAGELVVLGYDLLFADLSAFTRHLHPTPRGKAFVLTEEGQLVGLPHDPRFETRAVLEQSILAQAEEVGIPELSAAVRAWRTLAPGTELAPTRVDVAGEAWWVSLRPFQIDERRRVWLGSAVPEDDLDSAHASWGVLWFASGGLLVAFVLTFWLSRAFARPLRDLVGRSDRLASLDLSAGPPPRPSALTEVRGLSRALEALRQSLVRETEERDRAERARWASEQKYRRLIENMPQSYFFYAHGVDGVFTYLSPSVTQVLGYSEDEFLTHYDAYMTDHPINEAAERATQQSMKGVRQEPYELEIRHKDGSARRLEVLEVPVFGEDDRVLAVEGIARDVTQRRAAEAELKEAKEKAESAAHLRGLDPGERRVAAGSGQRRARPLQGRGGQAGVPPRPVRVGGDPLGGLQPVGLTRQRQAAHPQLSRGRRRPAPTGG